MITYQYFEGCPNANQTYLNLMELVEDNIIDCNDIEIVKIENNEETESRQFLGSPTILVNGKDIYTEEKPKGFSYTCRVYMINGIQTGVLSKQYIIRQIEKLK